MRALNDERSGPSAMTVVRLPDPDMARLVRLAARRRKSRSQVTRELLRSALDQIERADRGPPAGGST